MCVGMEMRRLVCHLKMLKDAYSVLGKGLHNELTSRLDWYANLRFICRWKRRRQTLSGEFCFFFYLRLTRKSNRHSPARFMPFELRARLFRLLSMNWRCDELFNLWCYVHQIEIGVFFSHHILPAENGLSWIIQMFKLIKKKSRYPSPSD